MGAEGFLFPGPTPPVAIFGCGVDVPETGRSEGREHERVRSDAVRDAFAAGGPGFDHVEGIGSVLPGTGRAYRGAPVPTPDQQIRTLSRGPGREDFPGRGINPVGVSAHANRSGTVPDPRQIVGESIKSAIDDFRDQRLPGRLIQVQGRIKPRPTTRCNCPRRARSYRSTRPATVG